MQSVTKIFTFDMGHRLSNYEGKCKRLHGHTYKCEVLVEAEELDSTGMVVDFGILKDIFAQHVDRLFDHRTLLNANDPSNLELAKALGPGRDDFLLVRYNPTAENIAQNIYEIFEQVLPKERAIILKRVTLWETPTSFAVYEK